MRNLFKPHLVVFDNGLYAIRELSFYGFLPRFEYMDLHDHAMRWTSYRCVRDYCTNDKDRVLLSFNVYNANKEAMEDKGTPCN